MKTRKLFCLKISKDFTLYRHKVANRKDQFWSILIIHWQALLEIDYSIRFSLIPVFNKMWSPSSIADPKNQQSPYYSEKLDSPRVNPSTPGVIGTPISPILGVDLNISTNTSNVEFSSK